MEAEEAFEKSDTAIIPVGTFHGHGPTPISIESSSVAWLAEKVGERTGLVTLPLIPFGENDKQKLYPRLHHDSRGDTGVVLRGHL